MYYKCQDNLFHNICPWNVSNHSNHKDVNIGTINKIVQIHYMTFHAKLISYSNPLIAVQDSENAPDNPPSHLKRRWCQNQLNSEP